MGNRVTKFRIMVFFAFVIMIFYGTKTLYSAESPGPENKDRNIILPQNPMEWESDQIGHGDPGWVRKMSLRRVQRLKAVNNKTELQALQTDHFYLPVLLAGFSDRKGSFKAEKFQNLFFGDDSNGTMTGYFKEVSYGQFNLTGKVYGWFQVPHPINYYTENALDVNSFPKNAQGFITHVVSAADPLVDFSQYDNDGPDGVPNSGDDDGYVDAVMVVFAGLPRDRGSVKNFTPVQWFLGGDGYTTGDQSSLGRRVKIWTFALVSEFSEYSDTTEIVEIGVPCHEFAHVLGLPDLYDYTGRSMGLGFWCLMSQGSIPTWPIQISAWCKIQLGWVSPIEVNENKTIFINPVEPHPEVYMVWEDGYRLSRYFLLENRQRIGFDSNLPGSGLLIYHVDENQLFGKSPFGRWGSGNSDFHHKLVDLEEADSKLDLDFSGNPGDPGDPYPGTSNNRTFDDNSNPDSRDYEGNPTGVAIRNIGYSGNYVIQADITARTPLGYCLAYDTYGITGYKFRPDNPDDLSWGGVLFKAGEPGIIAALDIGFAYNVEEYKIKIYKSLIGSQPSGLIHTVSGKSVSAGWHTIELNNKKLIVKRDQEFFITFRASNGLWLDPFSENTGRSYFSDNGIYFTPLPSREYGNFNIRARIKTAGFDENIVYCDFNKDGIIDKKDVTALVIYLYENPRDLKADFNRDGGANILDAVALLLAQLNGTCPEN